MPHISVEVHDDTKAALTDRAEYPEKKLSDVAREAFAVYLAMENPEEVIDETES